MSTIYIRRSPEQGTLPRAPLPKRGEFQHVHSDSLHLTLLNRNGFDDTISMQRLAEIQNEAPESVGESLAVRARRAIIVGQKAIGCCSVALEIEDPSNTLRQEFKYYQSLKEVGGRQPFFGHITVARGLQPEQARGLINRLDRKLPQEGIALQPVVLRINSDR